jgi:hypothetical protein
MADEELRKAEIFAKSHAQVRADLKLLDDKLARIVLSLTFLTGAAVALWATLAPRVGPVTLPGSDVSVSSFAFLTFVVAAGLSLLVALSGTLMVGLPPKPRSSRASLVFFREIATNAADWESFKEFNVDVLNDRLANDFHTDTLELAQRARYKALRALESLACLHLAITSFVLLAVFLARAYTITTRWWIASAFLLLTSLLPFADVLDLREADYPEHEGRLEGHRRFTYGVVLVIVGFAALLLFGAPSWGGYWYALPYALFGAVLAPRIALVSSAHAWVALSTATVAGPVLLALSLSG